MPPHEEPREAAPVWGWAIILAACLALIGWGLINYLAIADPPRLWDMGVLRDVPGQSIYSTSEPAPAEKTPQQLAPLPEGTH